MAADTKDSPAGSKFPALERVDVDFSQFYNSTILSDVLIRYGADGERKIYGHKLFLAVRSNWFKNAFTGQFSESKKDEIVLKEDDPDALEVVLKHVYHGDLVGMDDPDHIKILNLCSAQHEVADKYFFTDVKDSLASEFSKHLTAYIKENAKRKTLNTPAFTHAIARVYFRGNSNENSLTRRLLDTIFGASAHMVLTDTWAKIGQEVPEFGADMFSRYIATKISQTHYPQTLFEIECQVCDYVYAIRRIIPPLRTVSCPYCKAETTSSIHLPLI